MIPQAFKRPSGLRIRKKEKRIAYFSMEIGIDPKIPTYSGGLGILAGDTIKSCADLHVPLVAVTLLYRKGFFYQRLSEDRRQSEFPHEWKPKKLLTLLPRKVKLTIEGRTVTVGAWMYKVAGIKGYSIPIIFLDTDLEENSEYDRSLCHYLYGGDRKLRLAQEVVLGIGGVLMLRELGFHRLNRYHMNEGHASLLTLELLRERKKSNSDWDIEGVRRLCVFTTHTPVPAGHDQFEYELVQNVLGDFVPMDLLKQLAGEENLNMTLLALNLSDYVNGVAKQHGKVSREMFPGYRIDSITNGVHTTTWTCKSFRQLFTEYMPGWKTDPSSLRYALSISHKELWDAHMEAKTVLINYINSKTNVGMDYDALTIGFARRATAYKRADLVFYNPQRLEDVAKKAGKLQFVFAGKAHPQDTPGKEMIKKIFSMAKDLNKNIKIAYLDNYDIDLAKILVSGVYLWLNTPRKPKEASGTSGMKAALNGVPSFSILDGWWIEGCIEGLTGWAIDSASDRESNDENNANALYRKLEEVIMPIFYQNQQQWIDIMRHTIAINGSFFTTHRMIQQYVLLAYL